MLLSVPIRHRNIIMLAAAGIRRINVVTINPPELPVHACRPARGLPQQVLIVPV
jgi:hypothetical protein